MHLLLSLVLFVPFDSLALAHPSTPLGMTLSLSKGQGKQAAADPLLTRLAGQWTGTGTVLNQPSKISLTWSWELGGQFLRLSFRNDMPKSTFEGHAYYRATGDGSYRGMWFDNSGMFRPLEARRDGDALVSKWGTPDTEEGETTYRLLADGKMEIIDRVKGKDGTWRQFGRSVVSRD